MDNVQEIRYSSLDMLAPAVKLMADSAITEANMLGLPVKAFETYRTPSRQNLLYEQGRNSPGKVVTNAKAWESFHQYGLALDVVFFTNNRWWWDDNLPWGKVATIFKDHGFVGLKFEKPHFEINAGMSWVQAYNLVNQSGMQAVYDKVKDYCASL